MIASIPVHCYSITSISDKFLNQSLNPTTTTTMVSSSVSKVDPPRATNEVLSAERKQ